MGPFKASLVEKSANIWTYGMHLLTETMSAVVYMTPTVHHFSYLHVGSVAESCFDANSELLPSLFLSLSRVPVKP